MIESVLITGGAGYIGSHLLRRLLTAGQRCVALDSLDRGHRVPVRVPNALRHCDAGDVPQVMALLAEQQTQIVLHFSGLAYVGESFERPLDYYEQNCGVTLRLVQAMQKAGVTRRVHRWTYASCVTQKRCPPAKKPRNNPWRPTYVRMPLAMGLCRMRRSGQSEP